MRQVIDGNGNDSTAATQAYLLATERPYVRDLILIGDPESPMSIRMTSHEAPVYYGPYGVFYPAVMTRDKVAAKIGLDAQQMTIAWSPGNQTASANTATASPFQLAAQHFYDNVPVLILRCFMPAPGDAQTLGCAKWFGGRVNTCKVKRNALTFNCTSFLDVVKQKVPASVVEVTNTLASAAALTVPNDNPNVPTFACYTGSSENLLIADCLGPTAGKIYSGNQFSGGYLVFLPGAGATLTGYWSAIEGNGKYKDGNGNSHSIFSIYTPLPWPPTPGVDIFYVSLQAPVNTLTGANSGFPYVPSPQQAV